MGLFEILAGILKGADPEGIPIPNLTTAFTDGRLFTRLGIQTYGFTPMVLRDDMRISELVHGADERIPVEALEFGTAAIYELMRRYGRS
jgi:acetylornithine deacetylase/succinyl-diaminopimelate desuccinylase-like protein